jgi:4-carboxymuconolactone decarboxylase
MTSLPKPPARFVEFTTRFPELAQAWDLSTQAGKNGPLDERTARLIKLAVAIGAMREGAVHASVRKALAMGIGPEALEQVVALGSGTLGMPATVAAWSWVRELLPEE